MKRIGDWIFVAFVLALMVYTVGKEVLHVRALWNLGTHAGNLSK